MSSFVFSDSPLMTPYSFNTVVNTTPTYVVDTPVYSPLTIDPTPTYVVDTKPSLPTATVTSPTYVVDTTPTYVVDTTPTYVVDSTPTYSWGSTPIITTPTYGWGNTSVVTPVSVTPLYTDDDVFTPGVIDATASPLLSTLDLTYSTPLFGVYENLSTDPDVHRNYVKKYHLKALGKWLYDDLDDFLNYFTVKGKKVSKVAYKRGNGDKLSDSDVGRVVDHIEKNYLTKKDMEKLLHKVTKQARVNWFDLGKHEHLVKRAVANVLKKRLGGRKR